MATSPKKSRSRMWLLGTVAILACSALGAWWAWTRSLPEQIRLGQAAYDREDWPTAARLAQERLRVDGDDSRALRLFARATARQGRFSEAGRTFDRLGTSRFDMEDHFLFGLSLARAGQFDAAQNAWRTALERNPSDPETLRHLAQLAFDRGQPVEAAQTAARLAKQPGQEVQGDLLLGMILAMDHDPGAATEAVTRALARDPKAQVVPSVPFSSQKLLARTLLQLGRSAEARQRLQQALDAGPDREASWLMSRALLQGGQLDLSKRALELGRDYRAEFPMEPEPSPYVGESRCAECHRDIYQSTLASRHAQTLLTGPQLSRLTLPPGTMADPDDDRVRHRYVWEDQRIHVETQVQDKIFKAVAEYALGAPDRYTSLLGRDTTGRARMLRLSHYAREGETGWDRAKNLAAHPARLEDFLGEPLTVTEGPRECLSCHTTTVRSVIEGKGPEAKDQGIGCERCHGPGDLHLAAMANHYPDPVIAAPTHAPATAINDLCAKCHAQHFLAMPTSRTDPAWARFPSSNMPWSRCYTESGGKLHCVTCHDPHTDAETTPSYYESRCLGCHTPPTSHLAAAAGGETARASHSFCPVNPKEDCLNCHMPKVPYTKMHLSFTDHLIRRPDTKRQPSR